MEYRDGAGGQWQLWQNDITETGMQFTAIPGHSLYFRVRLKDHVDHAHCVRLAYGTQGQSAELGPYTVELETRKYYYFGGQRAEHGFGLMDPSASSGQVFNARYFSPRLGRFISADTIVPNPGRAIDFDRNIYSAGNPLRYIDPSGHGYCDSKYYVQEEGVSMGKSCGGYSYRMEFFNQLKHRQTISPPLNMISVSGWDFGDDNGTLTGHTGVDYDDNSNGLIYALSDGIVITSDTCGLEDCDGLVGNNNPDVNGGYGNVVVIEYPYNSIPYDVIAAINIDLNFYPGMSMFVVYAHLRDAPIVITGDKVSRGQIIGIAGNTGNSDGAHLHMEVHLGDSGSMGFGPMCLGTCNRSYDPNTNFMLIWNNQLFPRINPRIMENFYLKTTYTNKSNGLYY